jgi:AcrR family transcriptional regulator
MSAMATNSPIADLRSRLIDAAIKLLAEQGPSALQVRAIAKEAQVSTMAVYSSFGGMPELLEAVVDHGFRALAAAFEAAPKTGDPVADIFIMALTQRVIACRNPHLHDLMFGLSTRGVYRAIELESPANSATRSAAFQATYAHLTKACTRLIEAGRVRPDSPGVIAAQLWSWVHGFISLELAGHLVQIDDPFRKVMVPLGANMVVGLGDEPERARNSIAAAVNAMKPARRRAAAAR